MGVVRVGEADGPALKGDAGRELLPGGDTFHANSFHFAGALKNARFEDEWINGLHARYPLNMAPQCGVVGDGAGGNDVVAVGIIGHYQHFSPKRKEFLANGGLEATDKGNRQNHHGHAKRRGTNGQADDEGSECPLLVAEQSAGYEERETDGYVRIFG